MTDRIPTGPKEPLPQIVKPGLYTAKLGCSWYLKLITDIVSKLELSSR